MERHPARDAVRVVRLKIEVQFMVHLLQAHGAFHQPHIRCNTADRRTVLFRIPETENLKSLNIQGWNSNLADTSVLLANAGDSENPIDNIK